MTYRRSLSQQDTISLDCHIAYLDRYSISHKFYNNTENYWQGASKLVGMESKP